MTTERNERTIRLLRTRIAPRPERGCWLGLVVRAFPLDDAKQFDRAVTEPPSTAMARRGAALAAARGPMSSLSETPLTNPGLSTTPTPEIAPGPSTTPTPEIAPGPSTTPTPEIAPGAPGPGPAPTPLPPPATPPSPAPSPGPGPMPRPEITPTGPGEVGPTGPGRVTEPLPSTVPTGTPTPEIQPGPSMPEISPGATPTEIPTVTGRAAAVDAHAPVHWLAAGWCPDEAGLYPRLPEFAAIASPDADRALAELIDRLPEMARVHLVSADHVDPALVAEMVLAVDRNLQPWHRDGLHAFIDARRLDDRQVIRSRYTDRDSGFERFRAALR